VESPPNSDWHMSKQRRPTQSQDAEVTSHTQTEWSHESHGHGVGRTEDVWGAVDTHRFLPHDSNGSEYKNKAI
jgi:hypothetical protein